MTILFGPDAKGEVIEVGEDGAVIIVKRCPFLFGGSAVGIPYERAFHRCLAFNLSSQKKLNPDYASRYVRAMCMGDRQCKGLESNPCPLSIFILVELRSL